MIGSIVIAPVLHKSWANMIQWKFKFLSLQAVRCYPFCFHYCFSFRKHVAGCADCRVKDVYQCLVSPRILKYRLLLFIIVPIRIDDLFWNFWFTNFLSQPTFISDATFVLSKSRSINFKVAKYLRTQFSLFCAISNPRPLALAGIDSLHQTF